MFLHVSQGHRQGGCAYQKGECLTLGLQPSHNLISSSGCTSHEINMKNGVGVTWSQIKRPHSVAGQTRHLARNKMFFGWHLQNMTASSQMLCKACSELFLPWCAAYTRFWVRRNPNVAPIKLITFQTQTRWLLFVVVQMLSRVWLCDPTDCSPKGSSVHGIFQARILEWVVSFSRGSSQPRDRTCIACVFCIGRQIIYHWATREAFSENSETLKWLHTLSIMKIT